MSKVQIHKGQSCKYKEEGRIDFYSTLNACRKEFKDKFGFRLYMFSIQIITFATDMQIRWFKMLQKEDLKPYNSYVDQTFQFSP